MFNFDVKSDNPNSTLTKRQELDIASARQGIGTATVADLQNLKYAGENGYVYTPPKPIIPGVGEKKPISQGSEEKEYQAGSLTSDLAKTVNDIYEKSGNPTNSTDLDTFTKSMMDNYATLKTESAAELAAIEQAGVNAGSVYDPLITEAQNEKKSGMGKATVGAGERGGFLNTQYSGAGALIPTNGGWVGAGGELERIKSVYDNNINKLQIAKNQAIEAAKSAARVALETGKQQDFNNAKSILDVARQAQKDAQDMIDKRIQTMIDLNRFGLDEKKYGLDVAAEQRQKQTAIFNMVKDTPEGQTITIGNDTFTGIKQLDPFWTSASLVSLMNSLPVGKTQELTDPNTGDKITITGLKVEDPQTQIFHSVNENNGNETYTTIDKNTGKIMNQVVSKGTGARFKLGGGSGSDTKAQEKFFTSLDKARNDLRLGESWGAVWNTLYAQYKTGDTAQDAALGGLIDSSLDKDVWSKGGAFQEFKKSTGAGKKAVGSTMTGDGRIMTTYDDGSVEYH